MSARSVLLATGLLLANAVGCGGGHPAPQPTVGITAVDAANPPIPPRGSPEKAKWVGERLDQLRVGTSREEVIKLIGEPDLVDPVKMYGACPDAECYGDRYYAYLSEDMVGHLGIKPGAALISVVYRTVDGADYFTRWDGPILPFK